MPTSVPHTIIIKNATGPWIDVFCPKCHNNIYIEQTLRAVVRLSLQWRHNERYGVSNFQRHDCLHNRVFRRRSKKTSKFRVTGLCVGNSPVTGKFPSQMASSAENVSIWWRHNVTCYMLHILSKDYAYDSRFVLLFNCFNKLYAAYIRRTTLSVIRQAYSYPWLFKLEIWPQQNKTQQNRCFLLTHTSFELFQELPL